MSKHTIGPWFNNGHPQHVWSASGVHCIAVCNDNRLPEDQWQANARLIAAAPTLLSALKDCEAAFATWIDAVNGHGATDEELASMTNAVWANCKVAIAKAEGRS